MWKGTFR